MKRRGLLVLAISALLLGGMPPRSSAQAPSFALELPIDCALPDRCAVQFHVDRRQGPEVGDFRCGRLTYDTHRGTDFRVFTKEDFDAGIPVLAAALGKVVAIRDGMEDIDVVVLGRDKIQGRAGGNQVVIAHDDGWETYYWHLRKGSIAVLQGQTVVAGTKLGLVGLSGDTNFPHLHFELRRNRSVVVDPFDATDSGGCGATARSLWTKSAAARLAYAPMVARLGFTTREITRPEAVYGRAAELAPSRSPPGLFLWMELYGLARNDRVSLQWGLPDGSWRAPAEFPWQGDLPYAFRTGKLNLPAPLPPGRYSARLKITRGDSGAALYEKTYSLTIE
jgi:murein DD-endopeptidase MepM/ murein hydrolase activator NlpD